MRNKHYCLEDQLRSNRWKREKHSHGYWRINNVVDFPYWMELFLNRPQTKYRAWSFSDTRVNYKGFSLYK